MSEILAFLEVWFLNSNCKLQFMQLNDGFLILLKAQLRYNKHWHPMHILTWTHCHVRRRYAMYLSNQDRLSRQTLYNHSTVGLFT